jgi:hypothetical protein
MPFTTISSSSPVPAATGVDAAGVVAAGVVGGAVVVLCCAPALLKTSIENEMTTATRTLSVIGHRIPFLFKSNRS